MDSNDWFALIGLGLLTAGVGFVWWPLALIVPGAILLAVGVSGARRGGE